MLVAKRFSGRILCPLFNFSKGTKLPQKNIMDITNQEKSKDVSQGHDVVSHVKNPFQNKHNAVSVISKKTEKIATAIYMVTDFVPESEPLRIELRSLSLSLIGGTRKIAARSLDAHRALPDEVVRTIEDTITLVTLASTIGTISEMNARIIITELGKVKSDILLHYGERHASLSAHPGFANVSLTPEFFSVPETPEELPSAYKGHTSDIGQSTPIAPEKEVRQPVVEKPEHNTKKIEIGVKIARRNDVLDVVKSKGKVSIKDITTLVRDMSEKTIQRELHALVEEGVLKKEGEKRWSTYRIAS